MPDAIDTIATTPLSPKVAANPDGAFFMSEADWRSVQCYIETGLRRPTDSADAVTQLGVDPSDADDFDKLWALYATIHKACSDFSVNTYPTIVSLASDIVDYGRDKAPVFYGAIKTLCARVTSGEVTAAKAGTQIGMALTNLAADTSARATKVTAAKTALAAFVDTTTDQQSALTALKTTYETELNGANGEIATLEGECAVDMDAVRQAAADYNKDMLLVYTSSTYAWVLGFGTIPAAVVAGIYSERAKEAMDRVKAATAQFATDNAALVGVQTLARDLKLADGDMSSLLDTLNAALPVLEKAETAWTSLSTDIGTILTAIQGGIGDPTELMSALAVDAAVAEWAALAETADEFRANAYITLVPEAQIQVAAA